MEMLTFIYCFYLKVDVDFEGLFGNISSVIDLSLRLYNDLQETDSIGKKSFNKL